MSQFAYLCQKQRYQKPTFPPLFIHDMMEPSSCNTSTHLMSSWSIPLLLYAGGGLVWKGMRDKISFNNFLKGILRCPNLHVAFCQMVCCNLLPSNLPFPSFNFA